MDTHGLGNKGMNALVRAHIDTIRRHAPGQQTWIEVGVINQDYSLQINGIPDSIPSTMWWTILPLTVSTLFLDTQHAAEDASDVGLSGVSISGTSVQHTHAAIASHHHVVKLPPHFGRPAPGDSVLVAWIKGGDHPVILGTLRRGSGGDGLTVTPGANAGGF